MILKTSRLLLVYPPLDRSFLPPLVTASLLASVRAHLGRNAAEGLDLNLHFQRALLKGSGHSGSSCRNQLRLETLDAFCQKSGWEASEESLLLTAENNCTKEIPLFNLFSNFMGVFLSDTMGDCLIADFSLVGISVCFPSQLLPALLLANVIRNSTGKQRVVFGGPYVSLHVERLMALGWLGDVDYVIRGPGQTVLPQLVLDVAALSTRPPHPVILETKTSPPINRITPDFSDLEPTERGWPKPVLPYLASIGCSWGHCTFCRGPQLDPFIPPCPESLAAALSSFTERYDIKGLCFNDEALDLSVAATAFLSRARDNQIGWVAEARLDHINREIDPGLLRASGCQYLLFGLESGSQRLLKAMKKGVTIRTAEEIVSRYGSAGILVHLFLMVGFPSETKDDINLTLQFLERNERWIASASVSCFRPWPGTAIWQQPNRYGIVFGKASIRDQLENRPVFMIRNGPAPEMALDHLFRILSNPVVERISSKLPICHRACASLGNICAVLSHMDEGKSQNSKRTINHAQRTNR